MLSFTPVTLADRSWMEPILHSGQRQGSEYTFSNAYCWQPMYNIEAARMGETCLIRSKRGERWFLCPIGPAEEFAPAVKALRESAEQEGEPLRLNGLIAEDVERLEQAFPGAFQFESVRDNWDYLYSAEKLSTLSGKKLHAKRNFINRFMENPNWEFQRVSPRNLAVCRELHQRWQAEQPMDEGLQEEGQAVCRALDDFEAIGLLGGLLLVEGEPVAFTYGSPVSSDTFVVHGEKAFASVVGAYPMVNREFVRSLPKAFTVVNREDDVGELGLRKAKESYRPLAMLEIFTAVSK